MYAPAYAGAAVAEAKAKAKASMAKYLASLVKREEEGWTVLAAEVPQAPDERFFSSADELEQTPLVPAKRKAEDEPMEDAALGVAQVPKALTRPPGAFLELLHPPEEDVPMEELLAEDEEERPVPRFPSAAAGMFGHSYTLRQLWGVWEALPLHCCRALGSGARKTRPRIRPAWRAGRP